MAAHSNLSSISMVPLAGYVNDAQLMKSQWDEYRSRQSGLQAEKSRRQAEIQSAQELVSKLQQTLPLPAKRAADYKELSAKNFVSHHAWMEKEQARLETDRDLAFQTSRLVELRSAMAETQARMVQMRDEFVRNNLLGAQEARRRAQQLEQELKSVNTRKANQLLAAPIDGVVQQLAVTGPSAVVNAGQAVLVVVPGNFQPEIEAWLENKDVAYVKPGQVVALKIDAFPFVHYGTQPARVKVVASDAQADEKRGLLYKVIVVPEDSKLKLTPGMTVTAEVFTRKRRALDYFLDPIRKTTQEGLRER